MRQRNPSRASVVGLAAVVLAVLIAQVSVAGDPDGSRIDRLERQVRALKAELGERAEAAKKKKKKRKQAKPGPAGPAGAPGAPGPPGAAAGGVQFGWILQANLPSPGTSRNYSPVGAGGGDLGIVITPSAPTLIRDLAIQLQTPPGLMARWDFTLQGDSASLELTCSISSAAATTCNSGGQSFVNPPGGDLRLIVADVGTLNATPGYIEYSYRIGPP